ncbi:MAG: menaquinone biosynthesis protein [Planctomycetaceae bacterium]|nr:menaquinone biosynthesis protein [Planctomycetaceae bacterium]
MIDSKRPRRKESAGPHLRVGAVSYLNSKPLIEGLAERLPHGELILDYPSRLADELAAGRLDVALIPSIEAFGSPDYEIISDACVASRGPVLSVKLYFRVEPGEVGSLALDAGSRTSAALARIMLAERFGVLPRFEKLPMGSSAADTTADAVLLIGDRAMQPVGLEFHESWDLGDEWLRWTGLPFVFAMWVGHHSARVSELSEVLSQSRDEGVAAARRIAEREAEHLHLDAETAYHYLTENLHFELGSAERSGLKLFHQLAATHGLAPEQSGLLERTRRLRTALRSAVPASV